MKRQRVPHTCMQGWSYLHRGVVMKRERESAEEGPDEDARQREDQHDLAQAGVWMLPLGTSPTAVPTLEGSPHYEPMEMGDHPAAAWGDAWENGAPLLGEECDPDRLHPPDLAGALHGYSLVTKLKLITAYKTYLEVLIKAQEL